MSSTDYSLCSKTQAEARNEEFLRHAYGLFNRTALEDPGFVTATLAKYKKKEGQLWFNLLKRYGVQVLACPQATQQFGGGYLRSARETKKRVTIVSDSRDYQYNTILQIGEMDFLMTSARDRLVCLKFLIFFPKSVLGKEHSVCHDRSSVADLAQDRTVFQACVERLLAQ